MKFLILTATLAIPVIAAAGSQAPQDPASRVVTNEASQAAPAREVRPGARPAPAVDSVADDLQKIVVLCATKPGSTEFRNEWAAYVRAHAGKDVDVDALIETVLRRAAAYQAKHGASKEARARISGKGSTNTRKAMHDTAMNSIRNMKG